MCGNKLLNRVVHASEERWLDFYDDYILSQAFYYTTIPEALKNYPSTWHNDHYTILSIQFPRLGQECPW